MVLTPRPFSKDVSKFLPSCETHAQAFYSTPSISLASTDINTIKPEQVLVILQGECGVVDMNKTTMKLLVSPAATTCHIVVLVDEVAGRVAMTHVDSAKRAFDCVRYLAPKVLMDKENGSLKAYVVGGLNDRTSHDISATLFYHMTMSTIKFVLELAAVCDLNCEANYRGKAGVIGPKCGTLGYDLTTRIVKRVDGLLGESFKGPGAVLRRTRFLAGEVDDVSEMNSLADIWDTTGECIVIHEWEFQAPPMEICERMIQSARSTPTEFLASISTSPQCEPDDFCVELAESFEYLLTHRNPRQVWPVKGEPLIFVPGPDGWRAKKS